MILSLCFITGVIAEEPESGADSMGWQQKLLLQPSESQLRRERNGFVMIYDGMTDKTIEKALDEHYDRMSSMMFIRTVITDPGGAPLIDENTGKAVVEDEDDDC